MRLVAAVGVTARSVDARLEVPAGQTLALLGPNGSGKSTVIEALAGLVAPDAGEATLGGARLFGVEGGRMALTEPRHRGIALVTQDSALFPHLNVLDNVAFPARARGASRAVARSRAHEWLDRAGVGALAARRPRSLSGGQARRVAVARALASEPSLLLLDEPFASLDVDAASALRTLLREVLVGRTAILSTHDGLDAIDLAHTAAVLEHGVVVEAGATSEIFERPRTAFTAAMAGLVWARGTWATGALVLADGQRLYATAKGVALGVTTAVAIDPRTVRLVQSDARAAIHDVVVAIEPRGDGTSRVRGGLLWADVSVAEAARFRPRVGGAVHFGVAVRPQAYAL